MYVKFASNIAPHVVKSPISGKTYICLSMKLFMSVDMFALRLADLSGYGGYFILKVEQLSLSIIDLAKKLYNLSVRNIL